MRLWADDASALAWMAPLGCSGVEVCQPSLQAAANWSVGDVLIEAFGCQIAPEFIAAVADQTMAIAKNSIKNQTATARPPVWLNLEYLSAEVWVERCHGLPSPILSGPAAGLTKYFFYPGFSPRTGGLLREPDLLQRQADFDRQSWLRQRLGLELASNERLISLFCYEPAALSDWLHQLARGPGRSRLLVTPGRAAHAVAACFENKNDSQSASMLHGLLSILMMPALSQIDYDHLLWACDLNFVRGEDSLVRALWAGRALVWQPYLQSDGAHQVKLEAWLQQLQVPDSLARFHRTWNAASADALTAVEWPVWQHWAELTRSRLLQQTDLGSSLLACVERLRDQASAG